jgi:hypothetical protein
MTAAAELLRQHGITVTLDRGPGEYPTTCPQCSPKRNKKNKKDLNVGFKEDGSVTWYCHHCGWSGPPKSSGAKKEIVPSYIYRDRDGIIRFGKVRNPPGAKIKCWWCHREAGVWKERLAKGTDTKILYRADEVAEAIEAGQVICVVEGEKDSDNLWRIGIPATCNAHGASDDSKKPKWYASHSEQLAGADIVIFNDNDPPGYAHADAICKLSLGVAKRVRRLDLKNDWPEIPPKGDVSDWLAVEGHTAEKLKALIDGAPDYVPAEPAKPEPGPGDDDAEIARLAKLSHIEFDRARKVAAEEFGIRASILDKLVAAKRTELGLDQADGKQGRAIEFPDPQPWDQPVDGAQLLKAMVEILGKYVVMSEHQKVAIALWIMHAYLIDRSMISPRLAIRSPIKGCGKTTLLDVLTRLVPRPLATANVSPSAIFRVIAAHRPSLLIDEADTLFKDGDEALRGILNAGHRQGGTVLRSVGDEHEPRAFPCYAATVIALIGQLPSTLADRSVDIVLARRRPNETITAFRLDQTGSLDVVARQIARWAEDNAARIGLTDPQMPPGIYNRAADNLRPLLSIAEAIGGDWAEKGRQAAIALVGGDIDEVSRTELLLSDIRSIFSALKLDEISSADLIERLCEIVPRPWGEMGKPPKAMTQNKLARLLKPLAIPPELITDRRIAGYKLAHFKEAFERYLAPKGDSNLSASPNPITTGVSDLFATSHPENAGEVSKCEKSNNDGPLRGREVAKGGDGQERQFDPNDVGLSLGTFDALVNTYDAMAFEATGPSEVERLKGSLRKRLGDHGLNAEEIEIALAYIIKASVNRPPASSDDIPF